MSKERRPSPADAPLAVPPGVRVTRYAAPSSPAGSLHGPVDPWGATGPHVPPQGAAPRPVPAVAEHQAARASLVVGIGALVGIVVMGIGLLFSPFAWAMGHTAVREIDASGGALTGRSQAVAGRTLGIVGTCLLVLVGLAIAGLALLGILLESSQ